MCVHVYHAPCYSSCGSCPISRPNVYPSVLMCMCGNSRIVGVQGSSVKLFSHLCELPMHTQLPISPNAAGFPPIGAGNTLWADAVWAGVSTEIWNCHFRPHVMPHVVLAWPILGHMPHGMAHGMVHSWPHTPWHVPFLAICPMAWPILGHMPHDMAHS